jgi:two-component system chemotaxis sensor kinase CheA
MASERSAVIERWFGECTAGHSFWRYLSAISREFSFGFELGWDQLVSDALPCELAIAQLPSRLTHQGSTFDFRYLPFMRGEQLEGVLVVVQNVTLELQQQRKEAEFAELMQALRCTLLDRSGSSVFFKEATVAVAAICKTDAPLPVSALKNILHTLKGNAGQLGLPVVASICHGLEDELTSADRLSAASVARLSSHWQTLVSGIERFIGPLDRDSLEISKSDYAALISALSRGASTAVLHQALSWQLEPAVRPLRRLANQAQALAERLGKGGLEVQVEPSALRLDMDLFGPFFSDLGHIVRNAVDHGIEPVDRRRAAGKPGIGRLALSVRAKDRSLIFELSDDGGGIDWESVRDKGDELGLPSSTPEELLELLCHQGVTTRPDVSETSGRGVGMSAIKQRIVAMHGTLAVESSRGLGTTWRIVLPWAPEQALEQLRLQWQPPGLSASKTGVPGSA